MVSRFLLPLVIYRTEFSRTSLRQRTFMICSWANRPSGRRRSQTRGAVAGPTAAGVVAWNAHSSRCATACVYCSVCVAAACTEVRVMAMAMAQWQTATSAAAGEQGCPSAGRAVTAVVVVDWMSGLAAGAATMQVTTASERHPQRPGARTIATWEIGTRGERWRTLLRLARVFARKRALPHATVGCAAR